MSRVAKSLIKIPKGVDCEISGQDVTVKGIKGTLNWRVHTDVTVCKKEGEIFVSPSVAHSNSWAMAGTTRALINNMVLGCSIGFIRKLILVGVGYRAQAKGNILNLSLGFSHPIDYIVPAGIIVETPTQTEIVVAGADKQKVGQVASEIRGFRPPEPYKGKGIRYLEENVLRKEAKKK